MPLHHINACSAWHGLGVSPEVICSLPSDACSPAAVFPPALLSMYANHSYSKHKYVKPQLLSYGCDPLWSHRWLQIPLAPDSVLLTARMQHHKIRYNLNLNKISFSILYNIVFIRFMRCCGLSFPCTTEMNFALRVHKTAS